MQLADLALRQSHQPHAGEAKLLEQARDILLVTRQAVEGFGDEDLKTSGASILEHLLVSGPQSGGAADGVVRVDLTEVPLLLLDPRPALADLILDRGIPLII